MRGDPPGVTVLITDGEQRASLAVARALGRAGYSVFVCSRDGASLTGASRYVQADSAVADAMLAPAQFAEQVKALGGRLGIDLFFPMTEASILALLDSPLAGSRSVPFPDLTRFSAISDKSRVLKAARSLGLAVPDQFEAADKTEAIGLKDELRFPLVIKPARSVNVTGPRAKWGVSFVEDRDQFIGLIDSLPSEAYPILCQRRIIGPGVGVFLLIWNDQVIASSAHRRIREKPPSGGISVYRESIHVDPGLIEQSRLLLDQFEWQGVAMVEYKIDSATGDPYLMEVNGRFWGSLQLAIDSGVNFPVLLARLAMGEHPEPVQEYRAGIRSRWWWGDVDHLLARLRKTDKQLALPADAPGRFATLLHFLTLWRPGDHNEILRWNDPLPFVRETVQWFRQR